jgi:hypothetical protein
MPAMWGRSRGGEHQEFSFGTGWFSGFATVLGILALVENRGRDVDVLIRGDSTTTGLGLQRVVGNVINAVVVTSLYPVRYPTKVFRLFWPT